MSWDKLFYSTCCVKRMRVNASDRNDLRTVIKEIDRMLMSVWKVQSCIAQIYFVWRNEYLSVKSICLRNRLSIRLSARISVKAPVRAGPGWDACLNTVFPCVHRHWYPGTRVYAHSLLRSTSDQFLAGIHRDNRGSCCGARKQHGTATLQPLTYTFRCLRPLISIFYKYLR